MATTDPATLPDKATWYLATNLARPGGVREADSPHPAADLAQIVRLYGLRGWVEQSYKQVKDELGWADFQVRSDLAIRRHQTLVHCAFSFCWDAWLAPAPPGPAPQPPPADGPGERGAYARPSNPAPGRDRQPAPGTTGSTRRPHQPAAHLAAGDPSRPRLADPRDRARALVAGVVECAPAR